MKKEYKNIRGKNYYLLGRRKEDNKKVWLCEASWDCDWYWGLGYVNVFEYGEMIEHTHFDSLFLKDRLFDSFKDYFTETTLEDKEIWQLLELMQTLYTMRKYSDMLHTNGSHITKNECSEIIENVEEYERINKIAIPKINEKVYIMLGGKNE